MADRRDAAVPAAGEPAPEVGGQPADGVVAEGAVVDSCEKFSMVYTMFSMYIYAPQLRFRLSLWEGGRALSRSRNQQYFLKDSDFTTM